MPTWGGLHKEVEGLEIFWIADHIHTPGELLIPLHGDSPALWTLADYTLCASLSCYLFVPLKCICNKSAMVTELFSHICETLADYQT